MTTSMTAIADTILVVTSTRSMGASHTGLGVYEYSFSMRGNTLGVSTHRELFSYTPWGFPEHGGFPASYKGNFGAGCWCFDYKINTVHWAIVYIGFRRNTKELKVRTSFQSSTQLLMSASHLMFLTSIDSILLSSVAFFFFF